MYYGGIHDCVSDSIASVPSANNIGNYCLGLGIDGGIVNSYFSETSHKCFKLNNGALIELHNFLINKKKISLGKNSVRSYFGLLVEILNLMQVQHDID